MIHAVKIIPTYFDDVQSGRKTFEIRENDRDYRVGDFLALNEWDGDHYTGRSVLVYIDYLLANEYCKEGYVTMGIKPCSVLTYNKRARMSPMMGAGCYEVPLCAGEDTE